MIDLDQRFGFFRWRVTALALNALGNAIALYAAVRFIRLGTHGGMLAVGLTLTALCIALLARPDKRAAAPSTDAPSGEAT